MAASTTGKKLSCFAVRGNNGFSLLTFNPNSDPAVFLKEGFPSIGKGKCNVVAFSQDGKICALTDSECVMILRVSDNHLLRRIPRPQATKVQFSPKGTFVCTWQPYFVRPGEKQGDANLCIWECEPKDPEDNQPIKDYIQKKGVNWCPKWTADEYICARSVNNEVHCYQDNDFKIIKNKLVVLKVADFAIPLQSGAPYHVSAYVPGSKGQASFVRLWKYPSFLGPNCAVANKSFFKADRCDMLWNKKGTQLLVLTASDTSAESYYGDQGLHFMNIKGDTSMVERSKNGPVYSVEWSPDSKTFCVVYGFMPAKATLYNFQAHPIFDFGTGPRNLAYFNPHASILCLAGFGNLRGNIEFWDLSSHMLISQTKAPDTTHFEWCPDGQHFLTATTSPRLRVGNGYKLWHLMGNMITNWSAGESNELYEATFQPADPKEYPDPKHVLKRITQDVPQLQEKDAPKPYVPPHMRNNPEAQAEVKDNMKEDYEKPQALPVRQVSGARMPIGMPMKAPVGMNPPKSGKGKKSKGRKQAAVNLTPAAAKPEQPAASKPEEPAASKPSTETSVVAPPHRPMKSGEFSSRIPPAKFTSDTATNKKIQKVYEKLQSIDILKQKQDAGHKLNHEQVAKIGRESELLETMKNLAL